MYNNLKSVVETKGEEWIVNVVNNHLKNMEYRKEYSKRKNAEAREIMRAFKTGKLSFGGTRVEMVGEEA